MRCWLAVVVVAGCYHAAPQAGSPCDELHPCPDTLVCSPATQTCETTGSLADAHADGILIDGCTPSGTELCGDGIDQDCDGVDPPCPLNDQPGGAIDITAGGTFMADLGTAHDDASRPPNGAGAPCGSTGGRDVFYTIQLAADEAYYLDTFGSDFDSVIRVYHGACASGAAPNGAECHNDQCGGKQTQGIWDLSGGTSCVVVDQASGSETKGSLVLHVERGHRAGLAISGSDSGDTTGVSNQSSGTCADTGGDIGYYFTACPSQTLTVTATTCSATTLWDTALYAKGPGGQITCNDDDAACIANVTASSIAFTANGPHLFWIIVDAGAAGAAGPFVLTSTIN